jgi:DNA adenine methylase
MSVALGLRPERALLNDTNAHLINLYRQMRDGLSIPFEQRNDAALFYEKRTQFNELVGQGSIHTPEAAAIFYYLMRTAFNGLCRLNRKGEYNVPFGRYKTVAYSNNFQPYEKTLKRWGFTCGDFALVDPEEDDFIYADPPYDGVDFTAYDGNKFDWSDQGRLAEWLAAHKGPVVASNAATDRIRALYTELGFELQEIEAPRRIASNGNRATALEVLCFKNLQST